MVVLYRKYRPQKLSDLIGQEHIKENLLNSFKNGKVSHAYLFTGPRGTGKTTTARIIAKILNCSHSAKASWDEPCNECEACKSITEGSYWDVLEIDAASNRGIDDIRDLREKIKLAPTFGNYKVYIIDEVHMLTGEAFNALLKTLEEPPEKTVFILCTTELKKVPETIVSRCQKYEFKKAKKEELASHLANISQKEEINIDKEAINAIAKAAGGGFRDGVSLLDQIATGSKKVTLQTVLKNLALSPKDTVDKILKYLYKKDAQKALEEIKSYSDEGKEVYELTHEMILLVENELLAKAGVKDLEYETDFTLEDLKNLAKKLTEAESEMKYAFRQELPLELLVIEWCGLQKAQKDTEGTEKEEEILSEADSSLSMEGIKTKWPEFLAAIKPFNHSLESLLKKCEMQNFDGETLTLSAFYKLHKDVLMEPKNLKTINKCISDIVGNDIKIMLMLKDKPKVDLADEAAEIFK